MNLELTPTFEKQLRYWHKTNIKIARKIAALAAEISATPFIGTGKPEPLLHELTGCWSRRINKEHRIVYCVKDDAVTLLSCRYHYE